MNISIRFGSIVVSASLALIIGCNRRPYQSPEYHAPEETPVPVPEGAYSDPAATTPKRFTPAGNESKSKVGTKDESAANNVEGTGSTLPQGYFHCPPPGVTPPSATTVEDVMDGALSAINCPPGDPNASSTRTGLPGTPSTMGTGGEHPRVKGGDN
ncbi:MAG TPA: hypothetical protein VE954_15750 [Oligoflexus sp.]|uniref:hypothetical protein n=1 Tax=Oligoflexus sp. TaxID=1971216 RepID=UPI002D299011|nr:hypothetical protein [Oligoflexus sp.]HYX34556.1 hypothetical protein [Oligoflexus sp.]